MSASMMHSRMLLAGGLGCDLSTREIDLDNLDIDNFDALPTWERDAHIWINQQILCIKNENYEQ